MIVRWASAEQSQKQRGVDINGNCEPIMQDGKEVPQKMTYRIDDKRSYGKRGKGSFPVQRKACEIEDGSMSPSLVPGQPTDCADIQARGANVSGVYAIYPGKQTNVYCDMETDGGNWTVFQRRTDGSQNFNRNWSDYKTGFGSISSEHWLGNDIIHQLSSQRNYELRVDLEGFKGNTLYANYDTFRIDNETLGYLLTVSGYSGNTGDTLWYHNGRTFLTPDMNSQCARDYRVGWWYGPVGHCFTVDNNGKPLNQPGGIFWISVVTHRLKKSEMKLRPVPDYPINSNN
ncbi:fibrinogen C domain-containing protein 1-like [Lytechinus variegatus]|uniref:fibrinogen C domain-containing protein 1-like n=1 Tax=Lytechinus variegatus TaxID=7654 RepID=UPI001BB29075|nr:fibrinogen C domain-containing protein 1-like [Lytechinus variegatus]